MNIRKLIIVVIVALFLTTVIAVIQKDRPRAGELKTPSVVPTPTYEPTKLTEVNCGIYILPALPPQPKIRPMSERVAKSRELSEEHLLNELKIQRDHAREVQRIIDTEYRYYIKNCSKSTQ